MQTQMPPTSGIVITQIKWGDTQNNGQSFRITVNGAPEDISVCSTQGPWVVQDMNPPIIVRPNDILQLTPTQGQPVVTICGYTIYPGET